ncbi:DUF6455 family protein [Marivita sp. S6314]|uniref:DUF6455 family protein n=1 Tax=Marivita sp. S6314 TaxID=2926406 RepID=UPI0032B18512
MLTSRLGDPELHFWLTRSVARVMGVSLSEALASERLSAKDYADLVTECRGCALVETCKGWLGGQSTVVRKAPPGCANSTTLEQLAQTH